MEEIKYLTKEQSEKIINEMFERPDVKMFLSIMDWRDKIIGKNLITKEIKSKQK